MWLTFGFVVACIVSIVRAVQASPGQPVRASFANKLAFVAVHAPVFARYWEVHGGYGLSGTLVFTVFADVFILLVRDSQYQQLQQRQPGQPGSAPQQLAPSQQGQSTPAPSSNEQQLELLLPPPAPPPPPQQQQLQPQPPPADDQPNGPPMPDEVAHSSAGRTSPLVRRVGLVWRVGFTAWMICGGIKIMYSVLLGIILWKLVKLLGGGNALIAMCLLLIYRVRLWGRYAIALLPMYLPIGNSMRVRSAKDVEEHYSGFVGVLTACSFFGWTMYYWGSIWKEARTPETDIELGAPVQDEQQ